MRACSSSRAAGSIRPRRSFGFRLPAARTKLVGGVFGMYVDGNYTGKFADPFYGYDPDVAFKQRTVSYAAFLQDEWQFADQWKLIGGLRYWHDKRAGQLFRHGDEPHRRDDHLQSG